MSFSLDSFQVGDLITGKIIKLEPTGVLVDFYTVQLAYVPLLELSLNEIQSPEEAVQLNEIREFLVVGNYDGEHDIFFSHCSPETLKDSDRLYEVALDLASEKCGHPVNREDLIVQTKVLAIHRHGLSVRIYWFLCSQEHPPTVSFSIRKLEMRKAWERVRQLQAEDVTVYGKILNKTSRGALVKIEGLYGSIRTYVDKQREELVGGEELPLNIIQVREEYNHVVLIQRSVSIRLRHLQIGQVVSGIIRGIKNYDVFVDIGDFYAWLPTSKMFHPSVDDPNQFFKINDHLKATIIKIDPENGQVVLESCGSSV
ncbi:RNA-binding protein [Nostoc sp. 'Peltigera membranacea cyanobiont' 210A]|uniref:S1 RNA-binding domain-containing protein n=1 Tax=Nostoc sp. 'Peltigera membranacea cyanobiont' 210A TaxID=2014529 RepID=UPI000B9525BA|nr:S1 RNA-binding domain-containing protein [Nostoc sp. 'Peltigera membranacea cyanobiont' 210A]OYD94417.1 RNA-binding protein [Nostoc sp. 'Peltigera membranacea cyanobiont' 210A]